MLKLTSVLPLTVTAMVLAACASEPTCNYSEEPYMASRSVAPLKTPEGMSSPDKANSLVVPSAPANAVPVPAGETRCLDRPPSYFATTPNAKESTKKD
jgi:uncharacterized lipoprotein